MNNYCIWYQQQVNHYHFETKWLTSSNFSPQFIVADETEKLQSLFVCI